MIEALIDNGVREGEVTVSQTAEQDPPVGQHRRRAQR